MSRLLTSYSLFMLFRFTSHDVLWDNYYQHHIEHLVNKTHRLYFDLINRTRCVVYAILIPHIHDKACSQTNAEPSHHAVHSLCHFPHHVEKE